MQKKNYRTCRVSVDGSAFERYPQFKARASQALKEIFDWPEEGYHEDPIPLCLVRMAAGWDLL